jgi:hypothetical protein
MADVTMQYSLRNLYLAQQILSRFFHTTGRALNLSVFAICTQFSSVGSLLWLGFPTVWNKTYTASAQSHFEECNVAPVRLLYPNAVIQ